MSFKICTIGCGNMAVAGHGPAYKKYAELHGETVLAGCCDIDEQKAALFQKKFGFLKHYTDYEWMLNNEKPDAVCLVVPVHLTAGMAVRILKMGYPLIMEKPPGLNIEEARKIIQAAEQKSIPHKVAFNRRFMPIITEYKNRMEQDIQMEEVQNIQCNFYRVDRKDRDFSTTAIHGIDVVKFLAGSNYKYIRFRYQPVQNCDDHVINIFMDCEFENGIIAQLSFCPVVGVYMEHITINSCDNTFFVDIPSGGQTEPSGTITHILKGNLVQNVTGEELFGIQERFYTAGFYHENASFFDDIKSGRMPSDDVSSCFQSVEISQYIRERKPEYTLDNNTKTLLNSEEGGFK